MAGPVEHSVASEVGDILFEVGEGVRQYDECGVLAADHEVARLGDLGMLGSARELAAAIAAIPVDRTAKSVGVCLAVDVEIFFGEPARQ